MHKTMSRQNTYIDHEGVKQSFRKELLFSFLVFPSGSPVQCSKTNKGLVTCAPNGRATGGH
jgi:hypothetical protein